MNFKKSNAILKYKFICILNLIQKVLSSKLVSTIFSLTTVKKFWLNFSCNFWENNNNNQKFYSERLISKLEIFEI